LAPPTEPVVGIKQADPAVHALTNATIHVRPGEVLEDATLIVRNGKIEAVGDVDVPADAQVWDASGKTIYTGFIDSHVPSKTTLPDSTVNYWNHNVRPHVTTATSWKFDEKSAAKWRAQGIVLQIATPTGGLIHGTSSAVPTGGPDDTEPLPLPGATALHAKLRPNASWRDRTYPNSPMGAVALLRQAFYDAEWHDRTENAPRNDALAALNEHKALPLVVHAPNELHAYRALDLAAEFELDVMLLGGGRSYLAADVLSETPVIVPLNFRKPPDVSSPGLAELTTLRDLMLWDLAPENPGRLASVGVPILFTGHGLEKPNAFIPALRKAVKRGLDADAALAALTTTPAAQFGLDDHGTLEPGKAASFVVFDGDAFADATLTETWVAGHRYAIVPDKSFEPTGMWALRMGDESVLLRIAGEKLSGVALLHRPGYLATLPAKNIVVESRNLRFTLPLGNDAVATASITVVGNNATGSALLPDGTRLPITGSRVDDVETDEQQADDAGVRMASYEPQYPLGAYGRNRLPEQHPWIIRNATIWTCGENALIPGTTEDGGGSIVRFNDDGLITDVDLPVGLHTSNLLGTPQIDATGLHLTPGLIDCHSHIASDGGINESGQAITCEVRIEDFLDPTDIAIYRQLAGGTTTANVLHGSANP
ncbi:MAG: amidohydrolase family protein, partial [Planctomycetota bacterium]